MPVNIMLTISACCGFGTVCTFFEKTLKKVANCTKLENAGVKCPLQTCFFSTNSIEIKQWLGQTSSLSAQTSLVIQRRARHHYLQPISILHQAAYFYLQLIDGCLSVLCIINQVNDFKSWN